MSILDIAALSELIGSEVEYSDESPFGGDLTTDEPWSETPVPARLMPKGKAKSLWNSLKLSQQIGCLLWLNREERLTSGGSERLVYLQRKASIECLQAAVRWSERLSNEKKLQRDFIHCLNEANRRPQSRRFRVTEPSRIGVGYRDKGVLTRDSSKVRASADEATWLPLKALSHGVATELKSRYPNACEGEVFDLSYLPTLPKVERWNLYRILLLYSL